MINIFNSFAVYAISNPGPPAPAGLLPADPLAGKFHNVGEIIGGSQTVTGLLPIIYVIAGLSLLVMLVLGGIGLMTSANNPDKAKASYGRITGALIGFLIIFISYFVVQIVEVALGIKIL